MIFISARLNSISFLIFFHVKINWLKKLLFFFFYSFFEAIQLFLSKSLGLSESPIYSQLLFLIIEMPSLNRNERVASFECGREYTRKGASRHRKHCCVLKCSLCNFYTYRSEELFNHFKKKLCQHNNKLCAQQSRKTLHEKVNYIRS